MSNPRVVFPAIALAVGLAGVTSAQAQNLNQPHGRESGIENGELSEA